MEETVSPKASLGDVHSGYTPVSSACRWKAGVVSEGYPWWSSVAHSLDADVMVTAIRKRLTPQLLLRLPNTHRVCHIAEIGTSLESLPGDSEEILMAQELDVLLLDGCPPANSSKLWTKLGIKLIMTTETFPSRRKRRVPEGWYFERIMVEHKRMGWCVGR
jgi:hypothetical protein